MHYFKNESESQTIGNLAIDNRLDRVSLSGDLDLTLDKPGLALAQALESHLAGIIAAMQTAQAKGDLPERIATVAPTPAGNLFGMPDPKQN